MATDNATIAGRIWLNASNDFQQRVPSPSQDGMAATSKFLFSPMNRRYMNEFMDTFINVLGTQIVHNKSWENPLAVFKQASVTYGSTIQESAVKWIKAHSYNVDDDTLLKVTRPEAAVWYHTVNREDRYDISVELPDLEMAFQSQYGLNQLIDAIMTVPRNSDNYDEYRSMMEQIAFYQDNWGFYNHHVSAPPTGEADSKEFLQAVRADAMQLTFPKSLYSPVSSQFGIPVFAQPSELVLFITPDAMAAIDVQALAGVFQLDKADIRYRTIIVDEFPIPNVFALLTTDQFFVVADKVYQNDSFYNPQTLSTNYYLHHWGIVSVSPFVPAITYSTDAQTNATTITLNVTGVDIDAAETTLEPGDTTQLTVTLQGSITDNDAGLIVAPDSVTWEIAGSRAGEGIKLNARTYVDRLGVLHVQKTGLEAGDTITVTGETTYVNPSSTTTHYTADVEITVA